MRSGQTDGTTAIGAGALLGGRYRLVARVGAGGMGAVWQASDLVLDRPVAVKVLDPALRDDQPLKARLRREARAAARLAHPNVASVYDYGEDAGSGAVFIVMELLSGETLAARLRREGALPPAVVATVGAQVAAALAAAHLAGVVHRDVKPGNVFLTRGGGVKVLDFGIAATGWDPTKSSPDLLVGTPAYMSPERASGQEAGPAVDVYALGVVLYEALAGRPPFQADNPLALISAHTTQMPPPLTEVAGVPRPLAAACEAALAKDPARRPSAAALTEALWALAPASMPASASLPPVPDPIPAPVAVGTAGTTVDGEGAADPSHTARLPLPELFLGGGGVDGDGSGPDSATTVLEWPRERRRPRVERRLGMAMAAGLLVLIVVVGVAAAWQRGNGRPAAAARSTPPVTNVAATSTTASSQVAAPGDLTGAVAQVWQAVAAGVAAGEVRPDVATDLGNVLAELQRRLQDGQAQNQDGEIQKQVQKQLDQLASKVGERLQEGGITTQQRADQIQAAVQQLAASLGTTADSGNDGNTGDGGDNA